MLPERISYLRKINSMSQSQLANKIGVSPSTIGMYEQGRREPSLEALVSISRIFGVSLDYLATGVEYSNDASPSDNDCFVDCPCKTCFWKAYKVELNKS